MEWIQVFKSPEEAEKALEEGKPRRLIIDNTRICLTRAEGRYYAIQDACPHSGASLSEGWLNHYQEIVCPLHNYCYHLVTGREANQQTRDARTYEVRAGIDGIFVKL